MGDQHKKVNKNDRTRSLRSFKTSSQTQQGSTWVPVSTGLPVRHGMTTVRMWRASARRPLKLVRLADWLKEQGVKTVAMESTGVYWIPLFEILDSLGSRLSGQRRQLRHVPGRKTDMIDCQWLQLLHACGLLGVLSVLLTASAACAPLIRNATRWCLNVQTGFGACRRALIK